METVQVKVLSGKDITNLNNNGMNLETSDGHVYIQSFLINDKQNNAGDPDPFKVHPKALQSLSKSAVGRPWILPPKGEQKHVRGASTFEGILEYQKSFAAGEIVAQWINPETNNSNVIIDVFPAKRDLVTMLDSSGKRVINPDIVPPFVSPLVYFDETDPRTGELLKGRILHLQSVSAPGYDRSVAKINSVCENGLQQCMAEMRIKGASSSLISYQESHMKLLNEKLTNQDQMADELNLKQLSEKVDAFPKLIDSKLAEFGKTITEQIKGASAQALEGGVATDVKTTTTKAEVKSDKKEAKTNPDDIESMKLEIESLKKANEEKDKILAAEKEKIATEKRMKQASEIVEYSMQLKQVSPKNKEAEIKKYFDMKNDEDHKVDLSLLHATLKEQASKIKGAFGQDVVIASLETESEEPKRELNYMEINNKFGGRTF